MGMTQGTQTGALRQAEGWGGEGGGREGTWMYLWLILRKPQNSVKKLSFN